MSRLQDESFGFGSDDSFDEHLSQIPIEEERQDMTDVSMSPDYFYVNKSILKLNILILRFMKGLYHRPLWILEGVGQYFPTEATQIIIL